MAKMKVNFTKLLAAKSEELNSLLTPTEVAELTGIDRRKLYTLRDLSESTEAINEQKFPLKFGEAQVLCDFLGCKLGELVEYTPATPLATGQQVQMLRQSQAVAA